MSLGEFSEKLPAPVLDIGAGHVTIDDRGHRAQRQDRRNTVYLPGRGGVPWEDTRIPRRVSFSFPGSVMPPLHRKRKSRTTAPAVIHFTQAHNEKGKKQLCVYAECTYGGTVVGPTWSHTGEAVRRCLADLSKRCDCGRSFHKHRFTEGRRVLSKPTGK